MEEKNFVNYITLADLRKGPLQVESPTIQNKLDFAYCKLLLKSARYSLPSQFIDTIRQSGCKTSSHFVDSFNYFMDQMLWNEITQHSCHIKDSKSELFYLVAQDCYEVRARGLLYNQDASKCFHYEFNFLFDSYYYSIFGLNR